MRNEILRKITIVMAVALLLLTILTIVSFIVVSINDTKEQVQEFAISSARQIEKCDKLSELDKFMFYKENSNIRITIISSDGDVIKDTGGKETLVSQSMVENHEVQALLQENPELTAISKIESPYLGSYNLYSYYMRIETSHELDPKSFIIARFSMQNALGSTAFMIMLVSLFAFWVVMVVSIAIVFNYNIKAALTPLEKAQKVMQNIKNGTFIPVNRPNYLTIESEADKMVNEIEMLGVMINDSLCDFKMLLESIKQGVVAFDKNSKVILKNKQLDKLLGFSAQTKNEFVEKLGNADLIEKIQDSFNRAQEVSVETKYNDKYFRIETILSKEVLKTNSAIFMLIVISDITQEKNDQKFKNEFFANASHELKTPLTAINGYSEMIILQDVNEKQIRKCAEQINKNALRMREVIEDMLNLSKLENASSKPEVEEINVENVVEALFEELKILANKKNIVMTQSGKCVLNTNKKMLIMQIKNLLTNAIKYNKENGSIVVTLSENRISVKDTGIGIDKENLDKIFDRFYKIENVKMLKQVESSSGLGLALVKEIAKIQNADVQVFSELDKGSEFVITFNK